jgi:hypothetical protein
MSAREIADLIVNEVPDARLPTGVAEVQQPDGASAVPAGGHQQPDHPPAADHPRGAVPAERSRPPDMTNDRRSLAGAIAAVVVTLVAVVIAVHPRPGHSRPSAGPPVPSPVRFADGVLTVGSRRFALGRPGDVVALGRWRCTPDRTAALLRPSTGQIWVWSAWPRASSPVGPMLSTEVPRATTISARHAGRCDALVVDDAAGRQVVLDPWRAP